MTEEQSGGTTPEPEAVASVADRTPDDTAAAVAVADEPATSTQDPADVAEHIIDAQENGAASAETDAAPTRTAPRHPSRDRRAQEPHRAEAATAEAYAAGRPDRRRTPAARGAPTTLLRAEAPAAGARTRLPPSATRTRLPPGVTE